MIEVKRNLIQPSLSTSHGLLQWCKARPPRQRGLRTKHARRAGPFDLEPSTVRAR
jgi:hypothetical protein